MAPRSRILAWRIPWTEEPCGLQSWGREELDTTEHQHEDTAEKRAKVKAKVKATGLLPRTSSRSARVTLRLTIVAGASSGEASARGPGTPGHYRGEGHRTDKAVTSGPCGATREAGRPRRVHGGCTVGAAEAHALRDARCIPATRSPQSRLQPL